MKVWDEALRAPVGSDGKAALVGYIGTQAQAERWHAAGFDIVAATDRYQDFMRRWHAAGSSEEARRLVDEFYAAEFRHAEVAGISESDPDHFRFAAASRHYEWH